MRCLLAAFAAVFLAGCSSSCVDCRTHPVAETIFVTEPASGVSALATVGGRNVRVLLIRAPSIVRLREVFVPEGESVKAVRWRDDGRTLIVETDRERFALDTRSWQLAQIEQHAHDIAASRHARRRS
jgi:hypothetical protein